MNTFLLWASLICSTHVDSVGCKKWWDNCLENSFDNMADTAMDTGTYPPKEELEARSFLYCLKKYEEGMK